MTQKMYFLALDKVGKYDLWVTDGTTTVAVGGLGDVGVSGSSNSGLGPAYLTPFGQDMLFAGADALDDAQTNGLWQTDGTAGGTKEVGGVSPGPGKSSPFVGGNPNGLQPSNIVAFGSKAIFTGLDASDFEGLWVTDGTTGGTIELGGLGNSQIVGKGPALTPTNITAFNNAVLFDGIDSSGFNGLWTSDGTTAGTVEIGGLQNQAIFDSGASSFSATNFITLGDVALFGAPDKSGDNALWVTDGSALNTFELGGVDNAGIAGADDVGLGSGLGNAVRFGARVFFLGPDAGGGAGLWTTDGTTLGTQEVGGLGDAGLTSFGQHPSSLGLGPSDLTVNGQKVLFNGEDALGFQELWASDGTALGTYEIGGEGVGGELAHEAVDGVNPYSIVSLGNGKAVFIGYDNSNNQNAGKATLWVTDGSYADTQEIGGLDNQGVANIDASGFDFTDDLVGGSGLAYFEGQDAAGNFVLWETDGTVGGTKVVGATDGNAPATGLGATYLTMGPVPASADTFSGGGLNINLNNVPGETVDISNTGSVADTITGSNGLVNLSASEAAIIGAGVAVVMSGVGCAVSLSNTNGVKDSVFGSKGAVTLNGAQANVIGGKNTITFASGTTGNVVYLSNTNTLWDTVTGSNGTIYLTSAQASVTGGGDTIYFAGGSDDQVSLYSNGGHWDAVYGSNGVVILNSAQASILGGYDIVDETSGSSASLYNTAGHWDTVNATGAEVLLNGAQASVTGGGDTIAVTAGSTVSLYGTNNDWDQVNGANAYVLLTSAQAQIVGGGDVVTANAGSQANLTGTNGKWDSFNGSADTVILTGAQVSVTGGGDTIYEDAASTASLYGTGGNWDVMQGSGATLYLTSAQALVVGGGDVIYETGASASVSLKNTAGKWDSVTGSGEVDIVTGAQASFTGGGNVIWASGGSSVSLYGTSNSWDTVNGASEIVSLIGAQGSVVGGGNTIYASGGSSVALYSTNNVWDTVNGSGEFVSLVGAQASVVGGGDAIYASGGSSVSLYSTNNVWDTVNGSGEIVALSSAQASVVGGANQISGSAASLSLYNTAGAADAVTLSNSIVTLVGAQAALTGTGDAVYFSASSALSASGGQDNFYFGKALGISSIAGFQSSDVVHLSAQDWTSFLTMKNSGALQQVGGDSVITLDGGDKLTLVGVVASTLSAAQFAFA